MLYANELQMCLIMCCLSDSKEIQRQPIMFFSSCALALVSCQIGPPPSFNDKYSF